MESIPGLHEHLQIWALNRLNRAKFTGAAGLRGKRRKISAGGATCSIVLESYFKGLEGLGKVERNVTEVKDRKRK